MKIKLTLASLLLTTGLFSAPLSVEDLIEIAIKNNTNISTAHYKIKAQEAAVGISRSAYLPQLDLQGSFTQQEIDTAGIKTDGNVKSATLSASQLLYDFGKTTNNIQASKQQLNANLQDKISTVSQTVLNVKETYYDILNQYRLIEVAKESVKIDQLQLEQVQEYVKAGIKTKIDLTNAKLQLSNSKLDLLKAQYDLKTTKTKLITILGMALENDPQIQKEQGSMDELAKNTAFNLQLQNLISSSFTQRAEIASAKALIEVQKRNLRATRSDYLPTLNLKGSYQESDSDDFSSQDLSQYSGSVNLQWNLFSGLKTQKSVAQALANLQSQKEQLKQQELSIQEEVTSAFYELKKSIESLQISRLNVDLAAQSLELAQERYKNGLNDIVELNNSKLDFIKAKNELVNTYYTYKTSQAKLDYAIGVIYR